MFERGQIGPFRNYNETLRARQNLINLQNKWSSITLCRHENGRCWGRKRLGNAALEELLIERELKPISSSRYTFYYSKTNNKEKKIFTSLSLINFAFLVATILNKINGDSSQFLIFTKAKYPSPLSSNDLWPHPQYLGAKAAFSMSLFQCASG